MYEIFFNEKYLFLYIFIINLFFIFYCYFFVKLFQSLLFRLNIFKNNEKYFNYLSDDN